MRQIFSALAVLLITAEAPAQEAKIVFEGSTAFRFPVVMEIDLGMPAHKQLDVWDVFNRHPVEFPISAGTHTFETRNWRFGFPQEVTYLILEGEKIVGEISPTFDPRLINLKADQTLKVKVGRPFESYNCRFFHLSNVPCGIVLTRPYWYQDVEMKWEAKEEYPNSLFFLVDEEKWGPKKVFENLAALVKKKIDEGGKPQGDYRADCHVTFITALEEGERIPEPLTRVSQEDIAKICLSAYQAWLREKCYRSLSVDEVRIYKKNKWLPESTPDSRLHLPVSQGLEYAKTFHADWKKRNNK